MRFNPNEESEESRLLDPGEYRFKIVKAEEAVSKSGNDMIKLTLAIDGQLITEYLVYLDKMAWKVKAFCESVGMLESWNDGEILASQLTHREGMAKIDIEKRESYDDRNRVAKWLPPPEGFEAAPAKDPVEQVTDALGGSVAAADEDDEEEDLPF